MNRCSVCGRIITNKTAHFGLGCLKNMCFLIDMEKPKNIKGEKILNKRVAKITNKKLLSKDDKNLLTNRYLTLQLLNRVPLKYYDNAREYVSKDIENIGNTSMYNSKTIVTLKEAYDIYKLYNKYQKIKNRAEEVDSEYIQNFLFDNLLFAFSTYYRNKKYFGGVIADIQYYFWENVILREKGKYPLGTDFIEYSLQEKPEDRFFTDGKIVEDIVKDPKFIEKINEIIIANDNKKSFDITEGLNFESKDLFLALNNVTINVKGNKEGEKWKLNIKITDRYDFTDFKEIDEYCDDDIIKGVLGSTANNLAMISVASGVMHEYNVTIKFDIDR